MMRTISTRLLASALLLSAAGPAMAQSLADEAADTVFYGGEIRTPSGWVEAMGLRDGVIVATGTSADVLAHAAANAQKVDLGGATVLPGLHDSHLHALFAGMEQFACGFAPGARPDVIAQTIRGCVKDSTPGTWITGGNWVAAVFAPGQQTRAFLDKVAPDNPVVLTDESHHSIWVNSAALKLAGITAKTPNPANGVIDRDKRGEPTGLLREGAAGLINAVIPPASEDARRKALMLSTAQMLSFGITSFTDAGVTGENLALMADMAVKGELQQRVKGCIRWAPPGLPGHDESVARIKARAFFTKGRFEPDCVKIVLDGVPTESHTAAMLLPYEATAHHGGEGEGEGGDTGILMVPPAVLNEAVAAFDRDGLLIKFHAAGDAAVRAAIDSVAYARTKNGAGGRMHDVGHNSFVSPADIPRVRDLQMTWEFSPYIWYPTPIAAQDIRKAVGDARMERWIPIRDAVETGALVVAGSDWSVVPSVNPWLAIETMVTRQRPGGSPDTLGVGQAIDLETAFRIFTENGAAQWGERDKFGTLAPGMHGDFIVTARNPFKVPITEVHSTKVERTYIDGKLVFDAANPPPLKARN